MGWQSSGSAFQLPLPPSRRAAALPPLRKALEDTITAQSKDYHNIVAAYSEADNTNAHKDTKSFQDILRMLVFQPLEIGCSHDRRLSTVSSASTMMQP